MPNDAALPRYSYDPDPHEVFRVPPPETQLWRYMPLSKFLLLLESRRLFFCRISKFEEDPFEGSVTQPFDARIREWESLYLQPGDPSRPSHRAMTRENIVASCWHKAAHETEGMWFRYGRSEECVAIRSTVGRLTTSFPQRQIGEQQGWERIKVSEVDYIDYTMDTFPPGNLYYPFVHKRREFRHEQEVRALTMISEAAAIASASGAATEFQVTEMGLLLPVELGTLIEAVCLSPKASSAFERDVRVRLERAGLGSTRVINSSMAGVPIY